MRIRNQDTVHMQAVRWAMHSYLNPSLCHLRVRGQVRQQPDGTFTFTGHCYRAGAAIASPVLSLLLHALLGKITGVSAAHVPVLTSYQYDSRYVSFSSSSSHRALHNSVYLSVLPCLCLRSRSCSTGSMSWCSELGVQPALYKSEWGQASNVKLRS